MRLPLAFFLGLLCLAAPRAGQSEEPRKLGLKDGDRVAFVGDTFVERAQRYSYLETFLTILNPGKNVIFRNLGWSGDTVGGVSRAGFDPPEAGFELMRQQILAVKPTVVVLGYGMADSFAGENGLSAFEQGLNRLLNAIDSTRARVVLLSPIAHARLGPPLPDPVEHNHELARYRDVIRRVARERGAGFVDLFDFFSHLYATFDTPAAKTLTAFTDDGIHLTQEGYWESSMFLARTLAPGLAIPSHKLVIGPDGQIVEHEHTEVTNLTKTATGYRFESQDTTLPLPGPRHPSDRRPGTHDVRRVSVSNLAPGRYGLKVDGLPLVSADAGAWKAGVNIDGGPEVAQAEALRAAIVRKNVLFFDRWRPQNNTYLFGFRKHEQGNNAVEIPQFDPLVAEQEALIARLKKPVRHIYELTRVETTEAGQ